MADICYGLKYQVHATPSFGQVVRAKQNITKPLDKTTKKLQMLH